MSATLLFDTSVLIEFERGAPLERQLQSQWAISAMTFAELNIGALNATTPRSRQQRLATLTRVERSMILPFDQGVARTFSELVAWSGSLGVRPSMPDAIIAATAATHGLTLVTLDRGFEQLADFEGLELLFV